MLRVGSAHQETFGGYIDGDGGGDGEKKGVKVGTNHIQRRMPVHYSAMVDREGAEGATVMGGGRITGGGEDEARGLRCWWGCGGGER